MLHFSPPFDSYAITLLGRGPAFLNAQGAIRDSLMVAAGAMLLTLFAALPAAYALSQRAFRHRPAMLAKRASRQAGIRLPKGNRARSIGWSKSLLRNRSALSQDLL